METKSLAVGEEFPNKEPTNINPEKTGMSHSLKIKNAVMASGYIHMCLKNNM